MFDFRPKDCDIGGLVLRVWGRYGGGQPGVLVPETGWQLPQELYDALPRETALLNHRQVRGYDSTDAAMRALAIAEMATAPKFVNPPPPPVSHEAEYNEAVRNVEETLAAPLPGVPAEYLNIKLDVDPPPLDYLASLIYVIGGETPGNLVRRWLQDVRRLHTDIVPGKNTPHYELAVMLANKLRDGKIATC